jgi:polyhydroxybutyrate depolymerase
MRAISQTSEMPRKRTLPLLVPSVRAGSLFGAFSCALLSALTGALACSPSLDPHPARVLAGETYSQKLDLSYNGLRRVYRLHVPLSYDPAIPAPLVVVLHGAFSHASQMAERTGWSRLADRDGFVVVYPEGIGLFGLTQHWNAGHCCGPAAAQEVDDVGFVAQVIDDTRAMLDIDSRRIYVTGFSNGAMLTHRFGAEHGERLAAIAPLAGPIGGRPDDDEPIQRIQAPATGLPVIMFHGWADESVPYAGGFAGGGDDGRSYLSARDGASFWAEGNGCASGPQRSELYSGRVTLDAWTDCPDGDEVLLYSVAGWGHRWPGPAMMDELAPDDPLRALDATEIIWAFFQRHRREQVE